MDKREVLGKIMAGLFTVFVWMVLLAGTWWFYKPLFDARNEIVRGGKRVHWVGSPVFYGKNDPFLTGKADGIYHKQMGFREDGYVVWRLK